MSKRLMLVNEIIAAALWTWGRDWKEEFVNYIPYMHALRIIDAAMIYLKSYTEKFSNKQ